MAISGEMPAPCRRSEGPATLACTVTARALCFTGAGGYARAGDPRTPEFGVVIFYEPKLSENEGVLEPRLSKWNARMSESAITSVILAAVATLLTWIGANFVGGPIRKFIDLRGDVIKELAQYANVRARLKEMPSGAIVEQQPPLTDQEKERSDEAREVLRNLAAEMKKFAENESLAVWLVRWCPCWRYQPAEASRGLIGLSNTFDSYRMARAHHKKMVEAALRIRA